ncbi:MAG: hypothetical protein HN945_02325 [Deltaproteobacteria bacterium]|jgi:hypothetical protein|nr:hypothetical protein [Deltaproteobacteria bacterium]
MRIKKISYAGAFLKEADPVKGLLQDILGLPVTYDKVNPETVRNCFPGVGDTDVELVTDTVEVEDLDHTRTVSPAIGTNAFIPNPFNFSASARDWDSSP